MAVCSPATECTFHPWKATGSIRQPGRDARRIRMWVHDRAACRQTTATRHRCQGRRGSPLCARRGTDISIAMKKAFFFAYFLLSPNKRKYE
ncbi:MAG TPA: hypothetical protein P5547_12680 [Spirochaetota bacterium]|nr:hypothetical protein [Spirochaetota bacterium]